MHGHKKQKSEWDDKRKYGEKHKEWSFDESPKQDKKKKKRLYVQDDEDEGDLQ